jgi:4-hydroxy 2-oxovalerate aldolase
MRSIKVLDCTLRDGGFVNDWNFGIGSIKSIISRLDEALIDIIEIGFLDNRRQYDINRSILPDTDSIKPIFKNLGIHNAMIVAMIDYGTCDLKSIALQKDSVIDGIRVIFKKKDYVEAINFCSQIKDKGYDIFIQPVSVTSYTDAELLELLKIVNDVQPFGISIVDTYGLLHKNDLLHYFELFDKILQKDITIGYHAHNNFQVAYSNAIELLSIISDRKIIIDSSLYGMGKGAGNTNTELLAMHLNKYYAKNYGIDQLLEAIDVDISKEYVKKYWGYSFLHFLAASNDCHPDYVSYLVNQKTLSVKSINEILSKLETKNKLTYNKELINKLYLQYQNNNIDDSETYKLIKNEFKNKNILILGPGKTIETNKEDISKFIAQNKPLVVSINFLSDSIQSDYVFMVNAKRYSQFFNKIYGDDSGIKVICTSNISESNKIIDYKFNFISLINSNDLIKDNPLLMLLQVLIRLKIPKVYVAGVDGYSPDNSNNYFNEYINFLYCNDNVLLRNELIKQEINKLKNNIEMYFITPSLYV